MLGELLCLYRHLASITTNFCCSRYTSPSGDAPISVQQRDHTHQLQHSFFTWYCCIASSSWSHPYQIGGPLGQLLEHVLQPVNQQGFPSTTSEHLIQQQMQAQPHSSHSWGNQLHQAHSQQELNSQKTAEGRLRPIVGKKWRNRLIEECRVNFGPATLNHTENFCSMLFGVNLRKAFLSGICSEVADSGSWQSNHEFAKSFGKSGTPEYG